MSPRARMSVLSSWTATGQPSVTAWIFRINPAPIRSGRNSLELGQRNFQVACPDALCEALKLQVRNFQGALMAAGDGQDEGFRGPNR